MKTTYQEGVGYLEAESADRSKRTKLTHNKNVSPNAGYPPSDSNSSLSSPLFSSNTNPTNAFGGASPARLDAERLAATAHLVRSPVLPSLDNRAQQDLVLSLLLRQQQQQQQQQAQNLSARGTQDLQELLLAQLAAARNANNSGPLSLQGTPTTPTRTPSAISSLSNNHMDLLTRAAVLSGTSGLSSQTTSSSLASSLASADNSNRLIQQLIAAQAAASSHAPLASSSAGAFHSGQLALNQLAQQQPNAPLSLTQLQHYLNQQPKSNESNAALAKLGQQQQHVQNHHQHRYMLGTSIASSLPDAVLRQMATTTTTSSKTASPAVNLLTTTTPSLEERLHALRAGGMIDKAASAATATAAAPAGGKLDHHHHQANVNYPLTNFEGDPLTPLALASEQWVMSEYQCLLRQQIVFVQSSANSNGGKTQGRNKPIVAGQVGILCRYCARIPARNRPRGAVYFPAMLHRIYQAAQNMAHNHFAGSCLAIPDATRQRLLLLKEQKVITVGAGKEYWVSAAMTVGIREGEAGLFFDKTGNSSNDAKNHNKKQDSSSGPSTQPSAATTTAAATTTPQDITDATKVSNSSEEDDGEEDDINSSSHKDDSE